MIVKHLTPDHDHIVLVQALFRVIDLCSWVDTSPTVPLFTQEVKMGSSKLNRGSS